MEVVSNPFYVLIFLMFAMLLPGVYCYARLTGLIRDRYPDVWHSLAEPKPGAMSIRSAAKMSRFLRTGGWRALGDKDIERYVFLLRILEISYLIFFGAFILLFLGALMAALGS